MKTEPDMDMDWKLFTMKVDGLNDVVERPDGSSVDRVIVGVFVTVPDVDEVVVPEEREVLPETTGEAVEELDDDGVATGSPVSTS